MQQQYPRLDGGRVPIPSFQPLSQQSSMMQQPPPEKKKPLKVKLENKERGYYSNLFQQANVAQTATLGGQDAVTFFKKSGLPVEKLKEVWKISARTSNDYLTKEEFYVALKLIAYNQNGMRADEDAINFEIQVGFPQFEEAPLALTQAPPSEAKTAPSQNELAKQLPDLDSLNFDESQISGLASSLMPQKQPSPRLQPGMQDQFQNRQFSPAAAGGGAPLLTPQQRSSVWFLKNEDKQTYSKIFNVFDTNKSGNLSISEMQQVMLKTQLSKDVCAEVWDLTNPTGEDVFSMKMFYMAMHLMYKKKQNMQLQLPQALPVEMIASASEGESNPSGGLQVPQNPSASPSLGSGMPPQYGQPQPQPSAFSPSNDFAQRSKSTANQSRPPQGLIQQNVNDSNLLQENSLPRNPEFAISPRNNGPSMQSQQMSMQLDIGSSGVPAVSNMDQQHAVDQRQRDIDGLKNIQQSANASLSQMRNQNSSLSSALANLNEEYAKLQAEILSQQKLLEQEINSNSEMWAQYDAKQNDVTQSRESLNKITEERMKNGGLGQGADQSYSYNQYNQQQQQFPTGEMPARRSTVNNQGGSYGQDSAKRSAEKPNDYSGYDMYGNGATGAAGQSSQNNDASAYGEASLQDNNNDFGF